MTISARHVRKPRKPYRCDECGDRIIGWHVYTYIRPHVSTPPFSARLHFGCCDGTDAKINAAIQAACRVADAMEAQP